MMQTRSAAEQEQTASRQSKKAPNPHALLYRIMEEADNPHDRETVYDEFFAQVFSNKLSGPTVPMLRVITDDWFDRHYRLALRDYPRPGETSAQHYAVKEAAREMGRESTRKRVEQIKAVIERKAQILMLRSIMPNGQTLGECTGEALRAMREHLPGALDTLIAKVKPEQKVSAVFTEAALRKLRLRVG